MAAGGVPLVACAALLALASAARGSSAASGFGSGDGKEAVKELQSAQREGSGSMLQTLEESLERVQGLTSQQDREGRHALEDVAVKKVMEMLQDTQVKVTAIMDREEKEMSEFSTFCDSQALQRAKAVTSATRKISGLSSAITDASRHAKATERQIAGLKATIAKKTKELADAAVAATSGASMDVDAEDGCSAAMSALNQSTGLLKRGMGLAQAGSKTDRKTLARDLTDALGRVVSSSCAPRGRSQQILQSFLRAASGAGRAAHSRGPSPRAVLSSLADMRRVVMGHLQDAHETRASNGFDNTARSLADSRALAERQLRGAESVNLALSRELARARLELGKARSARKADETFLTSLRAECSAAENAWGARRKAASEEEGNLEKARKLLRQRSFFQGHAKSRHGAHPAGTSDEKRTNLVRSRVTDQLRTLGRRLASYSVMELVGTAAVDPVEKTRTRIGALITKLQSSARDDASREELCEESLAKSGTERKGDMARVDQLQTRMGKAAAAKTALQASIGELEAEISSIDQGTSEAERIRAEAHSTYQQAYQIFSSSADGVDEAINALKEYQAGTGVLLQVNGVATAVSQESSVIAILEKAGSEFRATLKQLQSEEIRSKNAHQKMSKESRSAKAAKQAELKGTQAELKAVSSGLDQGARSEVEALKALEAVAARLARLQPQCQEEAQAAEERKASRGAELAGLQQALKLLDGPALLQSVVQTHQTHHSLRASAQRKPAQQKPVTTEQVEDAMVSSLTEGADPSGKLIDMLSVADQDGEAEAEAEMQGLKDALSQVE